MQNLAFGHEILADEYRGSRCWCLHFNPSHVRATTLKGTVLWPRATHICAVAHDTEWMPPALSIRACARHFGNMLLTDALFTDALFTDALFTDAAGAADDGVVTARTAAAVTATMRRTNRAPRGVTWEE